MYYFLISRNRILDIKKYLLFLDIKKSISWYQEIDFLISRILFLDIKKTISWYQKIFLDIKKKILISRIHFLISRNRIVDIKKCWINSKTVSHSNYECVNFREGTFNSYIFQFRYWHKKFEALSIDMHRAVVDVDSISLRYRQYQFICALQRLTRVHYTFDINKMAA